MTLSLRGSDAAGVRGHPGRWEARRRRASARSDRGAARDPARGGIRAALDRAAGLAGGLAPCNPRRIRTKTDTPTPTGAEAALIAGLKRRDRELVFQLVERWSDAMLRLALVYVRERAVAEEVVQEAWIGALEGIDRFEGRSSLRTWLFSILVNQAKTRAERERRSLPFSALGAETSADPDQFLPAHDPWAGHWAASPGVLPPEEQLLATELRERLAAAIRRLPESQRAVVTLRDVEGWSAEEVCSVLRLSEANQRVLLHRARSALRRALDRYLKDVRG